MAPRAKPARRSEIAPARRNPRGKSNRGAIAAARRASARAASRLARNSCRVLKFGGSSGHQMRGLNTPPRPAIRNPATSITLAPMSPSGKSTARLSKTASVSASLLPRIQRTFQPASNSGASICRNGTRSSQSPSKISVPGSCTLHARRIGEKLPCGSPATITPRRAPRRPSCGAAEAEQTRGRADRPSLDDQRYHNDHEDAREQP